MSDRPRNPSEPGMVNASPEERLRRAAAAFAYPLTPDIATHESKRLAGLRRVASHSKRRLNRLGVGLALLFIMLAVALLVSPVRARVLEWIRIGSVRIFLIQPTATPPIPTLQQPAGKGASIPRANQTPNTTPTFLPSVLNLSGQTTLEKAREQAGFTIGLPAYPSNLGNPNFVYLQDMNGPVIVLVWMEPTPAEKVRMSLSESPSNRMIFEKYVPKSIKDTQVAGQAAVWIDGEYLLNMRNGNYTLTRLISQGHTLIWTHGTMTYRLEIDSDLDTAIRIAESIQP